MPIPGGILRNRAHDWSCDPYQQRIQTQRICESQAASCAGEGAGRDESEERWARGGEEALPSEVKVVAPGVRAAEGEEKGKGVTVRWGLEEAPSKDAGRRTGTGYEAWHTWDERARDREVLHAQGGVLYKSGVYASR
jgi:hypothetical protein